MRDLFPDFRQTIEDRRSASRSVPRPLAVDPWVASSLLQKAIRRGDADLTERAAITLHRLRGNGIWRRFLVIAFEDDLFAKAIVTRPFLRRHEGELPLLSG